MTPEDDRTLAEDLACPVDVQPGTDEATPPDWDWRVIGTCQPNAATFHINHSDVGRVLVDALTASDSPPDAPFVVSKDIPVIILDSLDLYWAGESRTRLPLEGTRVPVSDETIDGSKQALARDLAAQLRLLLLLATSRQGRIAPQLRSNLEYLQSVLRPRKAEPPEQT
jgi:hypothetical protein